MRNKKKIISMLMSVFMLCTCVIPANAASFPEVEDKSCEKAVSVLSAIGIIQGNEDGNFVPEGNVTRAEMATILVRIMGMEDTMLKPNDVFEDVPATHWAYGHIETAYGMHIVNGISKTEFAPDLPTTGVQALKMIISVLGYDLAAEALGGYPAGYLAKATQLGLLKGVKVTENAISRGDMAQLLYNALDVKLFEATTYTENSTSYKVGNDTILSKYLHIDRYRALLAATRMAAIETPSRSLEVGEAYFVNKGNIADAETHNFIADASQTDALQYLGAVCDVFVKDLDDNGRLTLLAAFPEDSVEIVHIKAADVLSNADENNIYYRTENGTKARKSIKGAKVILNGQEIAMPTATDLKPSIGSVTFISNVGVNAYNTVLVESYTDYVVDSVNYENDIVYFVSDGERFSLKLDVYDNRYATEMTDSYGKQLEAYDLYADDVLSIAVSANGYYRKIHRSDMRISGEITEKGDNEVLIDGTLYRIAGNLYAQSLLAELELGKKMIYYLDFNGEIAAVEIPAEYKYGYLVAAAPEGGGLKKEPKFKIYTEDGEMQIFSVGERLELNGAPVKKENLLVKNEASAIWTGSSPVKQLLRYKTSETDETILSAIETAQDHTSNPSDYEADTGFSMDYMFDTNGHLVDSNGYIFRKNVKFVGDTIKTLAGKIAPREKTKIFKIPNGDAEDDAYSMGNTRMFVHNSNYPDMEVFDTGTDYVPGAMVQYLDIDAASKQTYPDQTVGYALIQKIYYGRSRNGDFVRTLDIYEPETGKRTVTMAEDFTCLYKAANADIENDPHWYTAKNENGTLKRVIPTGPNGKRGDMFLDGKDLAVGDIVQFEANALDELTLVSVTYRAGSNAANVLSGGINDVVQLTEYDYYTSGVSVAEFVRPGEEGFIGTGYLTDKAGRRNGQSANYFFSLSDFLLVDKDTGSVKRISIDDVYPGDILARVTKTYTIYCYFVYRDWK